MKKYLKLMALVSLFLLAVGCSNSSSGTSNIPNYSNELDYSFYRAMNARDDRVHSHSNKNYTKDINVKEEEFLKVNNDKKFNTTNEAINFAREFANQLDIEDNNYKEFYIVDLAGSFLNLDGNEIKNTIYNIKGFKEEMDVMKKKREQLEKDRKESQGHDKALELNKVMDDIVKKEDIIFKKYDKDITNELKKKYPEYIKYLVELEKTMKSVPYDDNVSLERRSISLLPNDNPVKKNKEEIEKLKTQVAKNTKRIEEVSKESRQGISLVTAMAQINPMGNSEGKIGVGVGMGHFKGETGVAFGAGYGINDNVSISSKGAFSTSDIKTFSIGAGVNFEF